MIKYIFLWILLPLCSGCGPMYYPSALNMPLPSKSGEVSVTASTGLLDEDEDVPAGKILKDFNIQGSFAATQKFTLISDFTFNTPYNSVSTTRRWFGNMGMGYQLGGDSSENFWRLDVLGGLGRGQTINYHLTEIMRQADFWKPWMQVQIGGGNEWITVAGGLRVGYIFCPRFVGSPEDMAKPHSFFAAEPAGQIKLHLKSWSLITQVGVCAPLDDVVYGTNEIFLNVGVGYLFGRRK